MIIRVYKNADAMSCYPMVMYGVYKGPESINSKTTLRFYKHLKHWRGGQKTGKTNWIGRLNWAGELEPQM